MQGIGVPDNRLEWHHLHLAQTGSCVATDMLAKLKHGMLGIVAAPKTGTAILAIAGFTAKKPTRKVVQ